MITFKVDGKVVKASEFRVEAELANGDSIVVILTHEGIITDCFKSESAEELATSSIMYDERYFEMVGEE